MTDLTVLTPPAGEALSLTQAKEYLRIGHAGEDGLVTDLIQSARARLEQASGLALVIGGIERRLCLTLGALAEIETAFGCASMAELQVRLKQLSAAVRKLRI